MSKRLLIVLRWFAAAVIIYCLVNPWQTPSLVPLSPVERASDANATSAGKKGKEDRPAKIPLYVITPTSRPSLLSKGIFHILPFHRCFDLHWIVVHTFLDERLSKAPLFCNVFPWITELFTFNEHSIYGTHERNVGIEHVINLTSHGLVYFLDDDNALPMDLCQDDVRNTLGIDKMYYADQNHCGLPRHLTDTKDYRERWTCKNTDGAVPTQVYKAGCEDFSLVGITDTGSWLTPVWLLKQEQSIRYVWRPEADGILYTALVKALLALDGNDDRIERLPSVKFNYNELTCILPPWSEEQLHESLQLYRNLISEMKLVQESLTSQQKMDREEVTFHEYVHILHVLRSLIPALTATYVEIGVWKGATSIFMSRHPLLTNVIGIDGFFFERQHEEAEGYCKALQGNGTIRWIKSDSKEAIPELQVHLNGKKIDILFFDGDHTVQGARADFELYAPLVAEGGFIVFGGFMDTTMSKGVREVIMHLIRDDEIDLESYDVIGSVQNIMGAGPVWVEASFDWQSVAFNEFVLQKRVLKVA